MIVTTMNDIPGYAVDEVFGEVMGLTVRSRNLGSQIGAGLKSIVGGELKGMTTALIDSRKQVMERMVEEAEATGAIVFQAGTREGSTGIETSGGRVLGVTASGGDLRTAIDSAYRAVDRVTFAGMHCRRDIGHKGLRRWS